MKDKIKIWLTEKNYKGVSGDHFLAKCIVRSASIQYSPVTVGILTVASVFCRHKFPEVMGVYWF